MSEDCLTFQAVYRGTHTGSKMLPVLKQFWPGYFIHLRSAIPAHSLGVYFFSVARPCWAREDRRWQGKSEGQSKVRGLWYIWRPSLLHARPYGGRDYW
jgi:hypothetical protein